MQNQYAQEKQKMYEDRMKIFNDEAHRSTKSPFPPQRASFQSSKSIDGDSSKVESIPISSKPYESMTNLCQKPVSNLKEKSCSKPKIPMIREKSAPSSTPYLNPSLTRRTTTAGQHRNEIEKAKIKTLEEKYKKSIRKRGSFSRRIEFQRNVFLSSFKNLQKRPVKTSIPTVQNFRPFRRSALSVFYQPNPNGRAHRENRKKNRKTLRRKTKFRRFLFLKSKFPTFSSSRRSSTQRRRTSTNGDEKSRNNKLFNTTSNN